MQKTEEYWIQDLKLASAGRREIEAVNQSLPGLQALADDLSSNSPLKNAKIAGCMHLTPQIACFIETLKGLGAEIQWTSDRQQNTQDSVAAALVENYSAGIFAWKDQTYLEYFECLKCVLIFPDKKGPDLIVDDQGTLSEFIHIGVDFETYFEQNKKIPDLSDLGYVKRKGWANMMMRKSIVGLQQMQQSRTQEFDYYGVLKEFLSEQIKKDQKFFRSITQNIVAATDDSLSARHLYTKITQEKLRFTPMTLSHHFSTSSSHFNQSLASIIPFAITNLCEVSLQGKILVQVGFSGIGKEAAIAFRDIGGAKVIICESDGQAALKANLHGFEVTELDEALKEADFLMLINRTKISTSHIHKLKNNCIIGVLDMETEFDIESIDQIPDIKIDYLKPSVTRYTTREGIQFKILGNGLPLHFPCCIAQVPAVLVSTGLTCIALALIYLWTNKGQYVRKFQPIPQYLLDQATDYQIHSNDIKLTKEESGSPLSPLFNPGQKTIQIERTSQWRGSYVAEKSELEKLKQEYVNKEKKVKKIEGYFQSEDPIQDLNFTVDVGNDYITQVQGTLTAYKDLLDELKKIKLDQVELWPLFDQFKEVIKIQYKIIKDVGIEEHIIEAKKILKNLQDRVANAKQTDKQQVQYTFIITYLETSKELIKIKDRSIASVRDLQYELIQKLPFNINNKYQTNDINIIKIENYTLQCIVKITELIQIQQTVLLKLEVAKEHCLLKQYNDVCLILDEIIPLILKITGNNFQEGIDYAKDCIQLRAKFDYFDFYTDSLIDPVQFQNILRSYDILKKMYMDSLDFNIILEDANEKVEDLKFQIKEGWDEVERLKSLEWSLHRLELKPANVRIQGVAVCSGIDNDKAPASIAAITPEILDGYTQTLNKIIRGQQKNIQLMGGNVDPILEKVPPEEAPTMTKLPAQFKACLDLNKEQNKLLDSLQKESQTTLCLLTNTPDLNHNLFELEQDKRDLIKKLKDDNKKEQDAVNDRLQSLQDEYNKIKDEKDKLARLLNESNENIIKLNEIIQQKDDEAGDKLKEIEDLKNELNQLQNQFKQYKGETLAEINKLLTEIKKISVPLEAESDVQNTIIQRLAQVEDKEDLAQQIKAGQNAALDSLNIIYAKEKHLMKDSKQTLEALAGQEVPKDLKLFELEADKLKRIQDQHQQLVSLQDENDQVKQESNQNKAKDLNLEKELKQLQDENEKLKKQIEDLQQLNQNLESENNQLKDELKKLKIEFQKINEQNLALRKELDDLLLFFNQMQDKVKETESRYAKYQVLSQELDQEQQNNKEKYDALLKELSKKFKEVQDLENRLSDEQLRFQRFKTEKLNKICDLEAELHSLRKLVKELEEKIQDQEKTIEQLKDQNIKLQAEHDQDQDEIERLKKQIKELQDEVNSEKYKEMRKQLLRLSDDNKQLQTKNQDHQKNLEKVSRLQQQVEKLECQNGALKEEQDKIRPLAEECIKVKHDLENLKAKIAGDPRFASISEQVEKEEKLKAQLKESDETSKKQQQIITQLTQDNDALSKQTQECREEIQKLNNELQELMKNKVSDERAQILEQEIQTLRQQLQVQTQGQNL